MKGPSEPCFPCQALPEDPKQARLLGIYPQRGDDCLMQRVKVPQGKLGPGALRALAGLARHYTPEYPLHLTTRQDIELHGILADDLPAVQHGIYQAGLTSVAACGDRVRNVTVCPANGLHAGTWDVGEMAASIERFAESLSWIRGLPRKFKISLSGCPKSCARPWINDLGLVANSDGTLRVVIAGSLGPRPQTGMLLYESLEPGRILPLVGAALRLFYTEGERQRRGQSRLRHLRERLGDAEFRRRIEALVGQEEGALAFPEPRLRRVEKEVTLQARLSLPLGDIDPQQAIELAEAVQTAGAELRLGLQHDLFAYGDAPLRLSCSLAAMVNRPSVVACPGSTWCRRGIADSRAAAKRLLEILPEPCDLSIAVAGCPNNCPQAAVADIGLVGCIKRIGGERRECFRLLVGGGNGQTPVLARPQDALVPADEVDQAVSRIVQESLPERRPGQTLPETAERSRLCFSLSAGKE